MPLEYREITDIANGLDLDFKQLREDAKNRYDLYSLRRDPYIPEDIAREGKVRMLSPLLIHAAQQIRSDILMNPTEVSVIPLERESDGSITKKMESMSENLERSLAVIWGRINEGRFVDREVIWHQLVSPFAAMILQFEEFEYPEQPEWMEDEAWNNWVTRLESEHLPWSVHVPDPMTCAWIERDGQPLIFTRKYKMSVRDVEDYYTKRRGSVNPEANLRLNGEKWQWVSDDYALDRSQVRGGFREIEMVWLDDGKNIYHVCQNPGSDSGQLVWSAPNPTGRCTAFIVPGNTTPAREPENRYEPFLLPLMQSVLQINNLRSMRATAARNLAGPHNYIAVDPEYAKMKLQRGEKLEEIRWKRNMTPQIVGTVEALPSELSDDWDKLETVIEEEVQRFLPSPFVHIVDPAVLKAATATSILHAAETGVRVYGPLMSAYDAAKRDMFESIINSVITNEDKDMHLVLHAEGEEMARGKTIKEGSVYTFDYNAVNFPFRITVRSRGMSQAQAAAQFDLALRQWTLPDGSKGPATIDDIIDAANYTDRVAQKEKLAAEAILGSIDPWLQQMAIETTAEEIFLDSGMQIPLMPAIGQEDQPSKIPGGAQRMDSPGVESPEGTSSDLPTEDSF